MAEWMYDPDMDQAGPYLLQEDLTCPVCKDLFTEPVLLSCSHSFCKGCLEQSWHLMAHRCPVCRKSLDGEQPISNRALSSACSSFQKEKGWRVHQPLTGPQCNLHQREFQLYCVKDEEPVCVECVTLHRTHELIPLNKGPSFCKDELNMKVCILEEKVESFKRMKKKFVTSLDFIKAQAQEAEQLIRAEFERLHQVLHAEEAARLKDMRDEQEDKRYAMDHSINRLTRNLASLTELIQTVKREMGAEDLTFLQNFQTLKRKAQWIEVEPHIREEAFMDMAKHVGSLGFNIWKSMQDKVVCIPVLMDLRTASPWLTISPDLASVRDSPERQSFPDNPERFDPCVFILGAEGFIAGKHRWVVHVADNPKWILGVCKESVARKRKFTVSTDRGVWTIGLSKGVYSALTPKRTVLGVERRPEKIRIKLNMDKGEVSFWDADSGKHLCTFTHKFADRVFPIFGPGLHSTPMAVLPAKVTIHTV